MLRHHFTKLDTCISITAAIQTEKFLNGTNQEHRLRNLYNKKENKFLKVFQVHEDSNAFAFAMRARSFEPTLVESRNPSMLEVF